MTPSRLALTVLALLLLCACSTLPLADPLPAGLTLQLLGEADQAAPLSWSPDGRQIAYVHARRLRLHEFAGAERVLPGPPPLAVAWAPDGRGLAIATLAEGETRLVRIDLEGVQQGATTLRGRPLAVFWRRSEEIVALSAELKLYRFGGNLATRVALWDGSGPVREQLLHDATVKPTTLRNWGERLLPSLQADLSPTGDTLVFTRLHDPPEFPPYLKLVLRQLDGAGERLLGSLNLFAAGGRFAGQDVLFVGDGEREVRRLEPWSGNVEDVLPLVGKSLAVSPGGHALVADSQLWRDGALLAGLERVDAALFSPDGSRLLLRSAGRLFVLSGLPADPPEPLPQGEALARLLLLRRWRANGLISPAEFAAETEKP